LALDLNTGRVKWSQRLWGADEWNVACLPSFDPYWCPTPTGPDFDFGQGPALFTVLTKAGARQLVGAGQKSGVYWTLNPDDGSVVWGRKIGPGGTFGGLQWGSAVDLTRVYTALANLEHRSYTLQPSGASASAGGWAALDAATGKPLWQIEDPAEVSALVRFPWPTELHMPVPLIRSRARCTPSMPRPDAFFGRLPAGHHARAELP